MPRRRGWAWRRVYCWLVIGASKGSRRCRCIAALRWSATRCCDGGKGAARSGIPAGQCSGRIVGAVDHCREAEAALPAPFAANRVAGDEAAGLQRAAICGSGLATGSGSVSQWDREMLPVLQLQGNGHAATAHLADGLEPRSNDHAATSRPPARDMPLLAVPGAAASGSI